MGNAGCLPLDSNISQNEIYWYNETGKLGAPFITRVFVTPNDDSGYNKFNVQYKYIGSSARAPQTVIPSVFSGEPTRYQIGMEVFGYGVEVLQMIGQQVCQ
jgi:hypothetical protein